MAPTLPEPPHSSRNPAKRRRSTVGPVRALLVGGFCLIACGRAQRLNVESPERATINIDQLTEELAAAHAASLAAHRDNDWEWFGSDTSDPFVVASNGAISRVSPEDQRTQFRRYLEGAAFRRYEDLEPPIIRVAADGSLGWVIARVAVEGTWSEGDAPGQSLDSTWAWVTLYERVDGRWIRVANVSNRAAENERAQASLAELSDDVQADARAVLVAAHDWYGGELAVAAIRSISADAIVYAPGGNLSTDVVSTPDGDARFDQQAEGTNRRPVLTVSGEHAWARHEDGRVEALGARERSFVLGHQFHLTMLNPSRRYAGGRALPPTEFHGVTADRVSFEDETGAPVVFYYAQNSHTPLGYTMIEPGSDNIPITVRVEDWRPLGTLRLFHRARIFHRGDVFDYRFQRVELNGELGQMFSVPEGLTQVAD